ncbi:hypothetical protein GCM10011608_10430 [Micromonospora sonchi]|uniref:Uncharacterized protein n=1 Tax=Micromonospora sonchi TaxID=1763543 RepID=A0A917TMH2_9ACTN|nr:hypothetical protein [Micromonospora sonchi]GGM27533.1 hypothetical protein GCM10011608_10430 [Micromonospora sonchi]
MANPARILTQRDCTAMAALDTMPHLAQRVRNLLSHGRRITVATRLTHVDIPPEVTAGLTVDQDARDGGITETVREHSHHFGVLLRPGLTSGFGFGAFASDGYRTESEARKLFHAAESISSDPFARRENLTEVRISGGLPGDGPSTTDKLIVRRWNSAGVCKETVVVFDAGPSEGEYRAARWLYGNTLGPAHVGDRLEAWDRGKAADADVELWSARAAELMAEVAAEPR